MLPILQVRAKGTSFVAGLNDIPLVDDREGEGIATTEELGLWLKPGRNRLFVSVAPLERASTEPVVEVAIAFRDTRDRPLHHFGWQQPGLEDVPTFRVEVPFNAPEPPPTRLWDEAEVISPDDSAALAKALEAGRAVHAAFASKDPDRAISAVEYGLREVAAAFGDPPESLIARSRAMYQDLFSQPHYQVLPLDDKELRAEVVADGQLVRLTRRGLPLLESVPDEEGVALRVAVHVARIGGVWRMVR